MSLKSQLKNGTILQTRGGTRYLLVDDTLFDLSLQGSIMVLDDYTSDLNCLCNKLCDIIKFNNNTLGKFGDCGNAVYESVQLNRWTWERPKETILTDKEKEYLSAVIKPFRNKVCCIYKQSGCGNSEFITIEFDDEFIDLPSFKSNTMYKGMLIDKVYNIKELEI